MNVRNVLVLGVAALSGALSGCGSSGGTGTMNVHLVDAPVDYSAITLNVRSVEIQGDGGWIVLGTPNRTVNLLELRDGIEEVLVNGASLPAGHYGQMRLVLGAGNTVTVGAEDTQPLKVPSGMQSGVKFPVSFDVEAGTTKDVFIDFDAHRSIYLHSAGNSGQYILRPVVRAVDRVVTGSISGTLRDGAGNGLPDVTVLAETVDGAGTPTVVSSTLTRADGTYTLGLLPVGATYFVVAQPVVRPLLGARLVYEAKASAGLALSELAPLATFDAAFNLASAAGTVEASIQQAVSLTSAADADDLVYALRSLPAGASSRTLVVRVETTSVFGPVETATLGDLPAAVYQVLAERRTTEADGSATISRSSVATADLSAGGTVPALLVFP